ncbi:MAG: hypothetical protein QM667_00680 [Asticcacaulis sp.]
MRFLSARSGGIAAALVTVMMMAGPVMAAEMHTDARQAPYVGLSASLKGDFDGDGRLDDVAFTADGGDRQAVWLRLGNGQEVQVMSLDARLAAQVQRAPAGGYALDCGSFADHCGADIRTTADSLVLSLDDGVNVLVHWTGKSFDQDFIRSDEVRLSRAVATLFAFNP